MVVINRKENNMCDKYNENQPEIEEDTSSTNSHFFSAQIDYWNELEENEMMFFIPC